MCNNIFQQHSNVFKNKKRAWITYWDSINISEKIRFTVKNQEM